MKKLLGLLCAGLMIASCGSEEDGLQKYKNGIFVVNQGAFQTGTGTLTFVENATDSVFTEVYSAANEGAVLGNIAQSMIEHGDYKYIAVNNAAKIEVVEDNTLASVTTISDIGQPRYFASNGDRLFVSSWGATGTDGGVFEVNTSDNTLGASIVPAGGYEGLVILDDKLYIANNGGFGSASSVIVYDLSSDEVSSTLATADKPGLLVEMNDEIYAICSGFTDFSDPANSTMGAIVKIEDESVTENIELPNGVNNLAADEPSNVLYYVQAGKVIKRTMSDGSTSEVAGSVAFPYALHFDEDTEQLYIADAKDFASAGSLVVVSSAGTVVSEYTTGLIPGFITED